MKMYCKYSSPPPAGEFRPVSLEDLQEIKADIEANAKSASATEWAQGAWQVDCDGLEWALKQIALGAIVLVAQDDDGFYFATAAIANPRSRTRSG